MNDLSMSVGRKRKLIDDEDDKFMTPKKARLSHTTTTRSANKGYLPTPKSETSTPTPKSIRASTSNSTDGLPPHLTRLWNLQISLEQSLTLALATAQIAPDISTGRVPNVVNHLSLSERNVAGRGIRVSRMEVDDLKRLCWLWETEEDELDKYASSEDSDVSLKMRDEDNNPFLESTSPSAKKLLPEEDNPFVTKAEPTPIKDWVRGGMGFVVAPTTHVSRSDTGTSKRVPAYGIGIQTEWNQEDVVGGRVGSMSAVARWTAAGENRKKLFRKKLMRWMMLHQNQTSSKIDSTQSDIITPALPLADLPALPQQPKVSSLTRLFAASGSKNQAKLLISSPSPNKLNKTYHITPTKHNLLPSLTPAVDEEGFKIPFPVLPDTRPVTPSGNHSASSVGMRSGGIRTPSFGRAAKVDNATPSTGGFATPTNRGLHFPKTPSHRSSSTTSSTDNSSGSSIVETPTSARRQALYERIRTKSESDPGKKGLVAVQASVRKPDGAGKTVTKMIDQEELRRRCMLGRLGGVAEAVWMLFSSPGNTCLTSVGRKRRAIERDEVVRAVVKSSKAPISDAEAVESLVLLCNLCPFFLRSRVIGDEDWLEMPATTGAALPASPGAAQSPGSKSKVPMYMDGLAGSPGRVRMSEEELLSRSPRHVRREDGGLRQVREIIRRELEVEEDDL